MDSKHICLAHHQQTAPGPEHSMQEAPASSHWNKLPAYVADIVQVAWNLI